MGAGQQNNSNYCARNYGTKRSLKNPHLLYVNCGFFENVWLVLSSLVTFEWILLCVQNRGFNSVLKPYKKQKAAAKWPLFVFVSDCFLAT